MMKSALLNEYQVNEACLLRWPCEASHPLLPSRDGGLEAGRLRLGIAWYDRTGSRGREGCLRSQRTSVCVQIYLALSPLTFPQTPDELREGVERQSRDPACQILYSMEARVSPGITSRQVCSHTIRHPFEEAIVPSMAGKRVRRSCQRFVVKYFT